MKTTRGAVAAALSAILACAGGPPLRVLDAAPRPASQAEAVKVEVAKIAAEMRRRYEANPAAYPELAAWLDAARRQDGMPHMGPWWAEIERVRDPDSLARALGWISARSDKVPGISLLGTRGSAEVVIRRGWTTASVGPISRGMAERALRERGYADLAAELAEWEARFVAAPIGPQTRVPGECPGGLSLKALLAGAGVEGKRQDGALTSAPGILPLLAELGAKPRLARAWLTSISAWGAPRERHDPAQVWAAAAKLMPWLAEDAFAALHPELPELAGRAHAVEREVIAALRGLVPGSCSAALGDFRAEFGRGYRGPRGRPIPPGLPYDLAYGAAKAEYERLDLGTMPGRWRTTSEGIIWGTTYIQAVDEGVAGDGKGHDGAGAVYVTDISLALLALGPRSRIYGGLGSMLAHEATHKLQQARCLPPDPAIVALFSGRQILDGEGKLIGVTDGNRTRDEDQADVYGSRPARNPPLAQQLADHLHSHRPRRVWVLEQDLAHGAVVQVEPSGRHELPLVQVGAERRRRGERAKRRTTEARRRLER